MTVNLGISWATTAAELSNRPLVVPRVAAGGAQKFSRAASFKIGLSRVRSETARRRRSFSLFKLFQALCLIDLEVAAFLAPGAITLGRNGEALAKLGHGMPLR